MPIREIFFKVAEFALIPTLFKRHNSYMKDVVNINLKL